MRTVAAALIASLVAGVAPVAADPAYPTRPITIVVPWGAGNSTDIVTRRMGEILSKRLGQPVVVENKPGAGGITGTAYMSRAKPDGYTLLMGSSGPNAAAATLKPKSLPYDVMKDFQPIARIVDMPNVLIVGTNHPAKTFADLIKAAKEAPGKVSYASSGVGTSVHLSGRALGLATGTDLLEVSYTSSPPAVVDVIAGRVDTIFTNIQVALPQIQGKQVRPLAISGAVRSPLLPDVPTMAELGFPDFVAGSWMGLFAVGGTDPAIIEKLSREVTAVAADPAFRAANEAEGSFPVSGDAPDKFRAFVAKDVEVWGKIVKAIGLSMD
jgi:tripartite-type tricarboxylate transporter receptor subunit TctC